MSKPKKAEERFEDGVAIKIYSVEQEETISILEGDNIPIPEKESVVEFGFLEGDTADLDDVGWRVVNKSYSYMVCSDESIASVVTLYVEKVNPSQ
ncbi:hypothetical protein [Halorussus marinus]|uniref:hypothetical protein n=1 Tax=Halorussus marinus TaxID=2505976 RepID=UPI00106E24F2|nr:hypothetical protein [Halorussus marinus]